MHLFGKSHASAIMFLLAALVSAGCREGSPSLKEAADAPPETAPVSAGSESVTDPEKPLSPAPTPAPAPPPAQVLQLTPEIESSAILVRVSIASTIERQFPGVLLHHTALGSASASGSMERIVAVVVQGMEEAALRDAHCIINVQRNRRASGATSGALIRATLHHLDPSTGVAIFKFVETFPYRLDVGVQLSEEQTVAGMLQVEAPISHSPVSARLLPVTTEESELKFVAEASSGSALSEALPLLDAQLRLSGFAVKRSSGQWTLQPFSLPKEELRPPSFVPTTITKSFKDTKYVYFEVEGELYDPSNRLYTVIVLTKKVEATGYALPENPKADHAPITDQAGQVITLSQKKKLKFQLTSPKAAEDEHHLVQVQLVDSSRKPVFTAAPFLITLKPLAGGVVPTASGIALSLPDRGLAPEQETAAGVEQAAKELTTESPIQYGIPARAGREVLVKVSGAPHWKRLSLEKGEWLPLPAEDLSDAHLAGNNEAIYVLTPSNGQLKRFEAVTLAQEASVKLPEGVTGLGVAVGNFTRTAPVAVLTGSGILCFDPVTLEVTNSFRSKSRMESTPHHHGLFIASGDGSAVHTRPPPLEPDRSASQTVWKYEGTIRGYRGSSFSSPKGVTVSASYEWNDKLSYRGAGGAEVQKKLTKRGPGGVPHHVGVVSTSPVLLSVGGGDAAAVPAIPHRCTIYSYFSSKPLLSFDIPEFRGSSLSRSEYVVSECFWFDPASLSVACWHGERGITVRTFDKSKVVPEEPILLNFPETLVPRGEKLVFDPIIAGPAQARTALPAPAQGVVLDGSGKVHLTLPQSGLAPEHSLHFQLISAKGGASTSDVFVKVRQLGPRPVAVLRAGLEPKVFEAAKKPGSGDSALLGNLPSLRSRLHFSERPVQRVSELEDYLLLHYQDQAVGLFSLKEWKVVGTLQVGDKMAAYPAGDCLFVFDATTRSLARHSLPDLQPVARVAIPHGSALVGLSVGEHPESPVCLLLENKLGQFANIQGISLVPASSRTLQILNKQTLIAGTWAAFTPQKKRPPPPGMYVDPNDTVPDLFKFTGDALPYQIPCSLDGRVVCFPLGMLIVSPGLTTDYVFPERRHRYSFDKVFTATTTPSGDRTFADGNLFLIDKVPSQDSNEQLAVMSRCGNFVVRPSPYTEGKMLKVESTDGLRPLVYLAGVECYETNEDVIRSDARPISAFGRKNLLAALSKGGHVMQVIDFDLPALYKEVKPDSTLVTSHPMPMVAEGRTLDYQMTFNNFDAVRTMRIRDQADGASVSPMGRFNFKAPSQLKEGKHAVIGVEMELKTGDVLLHEIPIFVIPVRPQSNGPAPR